MKIPEIKNNLIGFSKEVSPLQDNISIYIAGGSAFILSGYLERSTRDIDVIKYDAMEIRGIHDILAKYEINSAVLAYYDNFPIGFSKRAKKLDIDIPDNVSIYVLSLEDLVVAKLCTTRGEQDLEDIENPKVVDSLDWDLLESLIQSMEPTMVSSIGYSNLCNSYAAYKREHKEPYECTSE